MTKKKKSKADKVRRLLAREKGATLIEIAKATTWQPHSCRAFLTGIRKTEELTKIERQDGATAYVISGESTGGPDGPINGIEGERATGDYEVTA